MLMRFLRLYVAYEGEGGGAGGGAPGGGAGAGAGGAGGAPGATTNLSGDGAGAGGGAGAGAGANAWKMPDGFPDSLKASSADEFMTKLQADWQRQRGEISKIPVAPKSLDELKFEPSEKAKSFVGDLSKDPVYNLVRNVALKAGMPADIFAKSMGGFYDGMVDAGLIPKPYSAESEARAFIGPDGANMTPAQLSEKLTPIVDTAHGYINSLVSNKIIDQAGANQLLSLTDTAAGLKTVVALQGLLDRAGIKPGGAPSGGSTLTAEALRQRSADPRNDPRSSQFDRPYAEETTRLYQQLYGK